MLYLRMFINYADSAVSALAPKNEGLALTSWPHFGAGRSCDSSFHAGPNRGAVGVGCSVELDHTHPQVLKRLHEGVLDLRRRNDQECARHRRECLDALNNRRKPSLRSGDAK